MIKVCSGRKVTQSPRLHTRCCSYFEPRLQVSTSLLLACMGTKRWEHTDPAGPAQALVGTGSLEHTIFDCDCHHSSSRVSNLSMSSHKCDRTPGTPDPLNTALLGRKEKIA